MIPFFIPLVGAVISGILATIITLYINHKKELDRQKKELAADIFGYRFLINKSSGEEKFYAALNRVPIIFAEDKDVIAAYDKLFESSRMGDNVKLNESLIIFLKVICKSLKINCSDWNDSKVLNVFGK